LIEEGDAVASKRQLKERWQHEPGRSILQRVWDLSKELWKLNHGRSSAELFALLEGLPYREEVPNGRDLRGAHFGGVRDLDLRECDFSHGDVLRLVDCDLTGAKLDGTISGRASLTKTLNCASFRKARFRGTYMDHVEARECCFDGARLNDVFLAYSDLTGSSFCNAHLKLCSLGGATLFGCDFHGATLDEVVFLESRFDKSTDLRGAKLINVTTDEYDQGKLVRKGVDLGEANCDETTRFIKDQSLIELPVLAEACKVLGELSDPQAQRLRPILVAKLAELQKNYRETWTEELFAQLDPPDQDFLENVVFVEAAKRL
jgi:uncharacterized protein YjbI with pentapeptide repeats